MKVYLENKAIYVKDEEKFIYKVTSYEVYDNSDTIYLTLNLVAGIDYIDIDNNNTQGYVSAENFTEDIQEVTVIQYLFKEGMIEALEENGYKVIEKLPEIR